MTNKILTLTKKLIRIHSTAHNPVGLNHVLEVAKEEIGKQYTIEEFESNDIKSLLIHNAKPKTKQFKIILNCHLDVVPARTEQFNPIEKDGKLYGRGAYDVKATAAILIILFKELAHKLPYNIALQLTTDEEIGGHNGVVHQIKKGIRADFIMTGECGSNLNIVNETKGIMWFKLHTKGTKAHGAYPWRGENALWKLHTALASLHKIFPVPDKEEWSTTINLAKIETDNKVFNHVPDGATAYVDMRFIPEDEKGLIEKIEKIIGHNVEMDVQFKESPEYISPENKYVKLLEKLTTKVTGKTAKLLSIHAQSDLRHYNAVDCHGVEFSPIGAHQHGDDEWVDIKSIGQYYDILEQFLLSVK